MQVVFIKSFRRKISIIGIFLFLLNQILIAQDKRVELKTTFSNIDNAGSAKTIPYNLTYKNNSPFVMLSGYTTDLTFNKTVYYRLKSNKHWGKWIAFHEPHDGEDFDRYVLGEVFIEQAFKDIQFKTDKPSNTQFTFRLFFPEYTKNTKNKNTKIITNKQTVAGCAQPAFQGRSDWCPTGDCPKQSNPSIINPDHIVVHHSAGQTFSNDYAAVVRGYWDYHVNSRGWADIGYNWLVDPNGVLYEGRGDRIRGAHSPCMNAISTGICLIGDYELNEPATAGLNTLKDMIAWEASDKNIDVKGSSYVSALNGNIENVSGHKDGYDEYPGAGCTSTSCPGVNLHNKLQTIRDDVALYSCYISSSNTPKTPTSFSAIRKSSTSIEIKIKSVANATKYGIYKSVDNISFQKVKESSSTTIQIENLIQGEVIYFKVEAINNDGVSDKSSVLAATPSLYPSEILIVDGVERRQKDIVSDYDYPLSALNRTFSSATNDAVQDGTTILEDFQFVIWSLLDESTADDTFNKTEQAKVKSYIDNGGVFIVSGNEIGWDLVHKGDATDQSFYSNVLKAKYVSDNPNPLNYIVSDNNGVDYDLIQNPNDYMDARYPDLISPLNGASNYFSFKGISNNTGVAGIGYKTTNGGVAYLSFAIESVTNKNQRKTLLEYLLNNYSSLLSVNDSFIHKNIRIFPNPSLGLINISNPNNIKISKIKIYSIYGKQLKVNTINKAIDLSNYDSGIYIINIEDQNGKQGIFKIIKK